MKRRTRPRRVPLGNAQSLPLEGHLTLGFDAGRFPPTPPACYRASWQLPGPDSHRQATTSLSTADHLSTVTSCLLGARKREAKWRAGGGPGRCGGTAGPRSGRPGRGGVGPFAWVPADLSYGVRLASLAQHSRGATTSGRRRCARRRSGLAGKGKNVWFRGCIRRPMGHPPGPTTRTAVRGAPPLREKLVSSIGRQKAKARRFLSLPLLMYSALGGLRQDPGRGAESSAEATTCGDGGTTCVCCCRRMGDAVTSNQWWDWRCGCGRSGRRCGGARRPAGRSGRPTRQREGNQG
jgi:hypothetical protein